MTLTTEIAIALDPVNAGSTARKFIQRLQTGTVEAGEKAPQAGMWEQYLTPLNEIYQETLESKGDNEESRQVAARKAAAFLRTLKKGDKNLYTLMEMTHAISIIKEPTKTPKLTSSKLDYKKYNIDASMKWLNDYTDWSQSWMKKAPRSWHMIGGLFAISTLIARRALITGSGTDLVTHFYALLIGPSGAGKSSIKNHAELMLNKIYGMGDVLIRKEVPSAQALIADMSGKLATDYDDLEEAEQEVEKIRVLYSRFMSLYSDEFGQMLIAISNPGANSSIGLYNRILLEAHAGKIEGQLTVARGKESIGECYLPFLGCTVEDTFAKLSPKNDVFTAGLLGRMLVIYEEFIKPQRMTAGRITVPESIYEPLQSLHRNLGIPTCYVEQVQQTAAQALKKAKIKYRAVKNYPTPLELNLEQSPEVYDAFQNYMYDLDCIAIEGNIPSQIKPNYGRLAVNTLVIASLLALSNKGADPEWCKHPSITMDDWAAAQYISEKFFRPMLHACQEKLFAGEKSFTRDMEDRVLAVFVKNPGKWMSLATVYNVHTKNIDKRMLNQILMEMEASEDIVTCTILKRGKGAEMKMYASVGTPPLENSTGYPDWAMEEITPSEV